MLMEVGGPEASHPPPVDHGHGIVDPQLQQQDPAQGSARGPEGE
jgi:hypothetical protein